MDAQKLNIHQWLIEPSRVVEITTTECGGYQLIWTTRDGDRLSIISESLEAALLRAHSLDTESGNRETLLRMAFRPTAHVEAWTTGINRDGLYGWSGRVLIASQMPESAEFRVPTLPKGWKWDGFNSFERKLKPAGLYGYLMGGELAREGIIENGAFHFELYAAHSLFIKDNSILEFLGQAVAEFERRHFIIS